MKNKVKSFFKSKVKSFSENKDGATAIEYALIATGIGLLLVISLASISSTLAAKFNFISGSI